MKKKLIWGLGCLTASIAGVGIFAKLSPVPVITAARNTLFKVPKDTRKKRYIDGNVQVFVDEIYFSKYQNNYFDLYLPQNPLTSKPVIAWIHGGGFIGGDKLEEREYATKLAEQGYTVAVMNYELVPKTKYPIPVIQAAEFLTHLIKHAERYSINLNNLFIAGDSAGAQIASQLVAAQTNPAYGQLLGIKNVINRQQIRGVLLYCGVYDLPEIVSNYEMAVVRFIFDRIGWGYAKDKQWSKAEVTKSSVVLNFITSEFPPTYVTDGNFLSFEAQGKLLVNKLRAQNIPVSQRFFDPFQYKTAHEYQFDLAEEPGKIVFKDTLEFLKNYQKKLL